jgi:HAD superfamily hydrolase (TIGR01490 family)
MDLVLFDLDNTLLAGDSNTEWAKLLIEKGALEAAEYHARNQVFYRAYLDGTLDIRGYLEYQLAPLTRYPRATLDGWLAEFVAQRVPLLIPPAARALVRRHLSEGALAAVVTATASFVTRPIAASLGIAHLVASEPETIEGAFTGRIAGTPCFREAKIERVEQWLAALGLGWAHFERTLFYSDSANDLPLLERVSHPAVVDPDPTLESHARLHGWPVIRLRAGLGPGEFGYHPVSTEKRPREA